MNNSYKRVVITGIGALTPIGNTKDQYWNGLKAGKSGADTITKFDTEGFTTNFACELKNFNLQDHFDKKQIRQNDHYALYALIATEEAVMDSGLAESDYNKERAGVIWASGIGGLLTLQEDYKKFLLNKSSKKFSPFFISKLISNIASGLISIKYGHKGPGYCIVSACASSTHALLDAFNYIRSGKIDIMITGGSEAAINEIGIGGFGSMQAISKRNDEPETASRPYDKTRDGFVMGEGAGALILEELSHAKARGAKIYAEIIGGGATLDAYHLTAPHPEGDGAYRAMNLAIEESSIETGDIDYINCHATSTPVGDICETNAIEKLFNEKLDKLVISGTKSMTGHLLGAAGAIEAIACIFAISEDTIPPTINTTELDEKISPDINIVLGTPLEKKINIAMSNTFGFGGQNAIAVFRRYKE